MSVVVDLTVVDVVAGFVVVVVAVDVTSVV